MSLPSFATCFTVGDVITVVGFVITLYLTNKDSRERLYKQHQLELDFKAKELEAKRGEGLHNVRIEAYKYLWYPTKFWAKYYRGEPKTYGDTKALLDVLHD